MFEDCGYKIENIWCNKQWYAFGSRFTQCDPDNIGDKQSGWNISGKNFIAENIKAVKGMAKGICKPKKIVKTIKYRLVPPQAVTFGKPSRSASDVSHTPIDLVLQYHYAREWFRERDREACDRIRMRKMNKPETNRSTNSSRLRRHVEPCREKPRWLMKKFANMKVTHLDTFRGKNLRDEAFKRREKLELPPLDATGDSKDGANSYQNNDTC